MFSKVDLGFLHDLKRTFARSSTGLGDKNEVYIFANFLKPKVLSNTKICLRGLCQQQKKYINFEIGLNNTYDRLGLWRISGSGSRRRCDRGSRLLRNFWMTRMRRSELKSTICEKRSGPT